MSGDCSCLVNHFGFLARRDAHYAAAMPSASGPSGPPAGLCDSCRHQQVVRTKRSTFSLCRRWKEDAAYPRYPRLPVLRCRGHEERGADAGEAATTP
jgi:hypothetical protein